MSEEEEKRLKIQKYLTLSWDFRLKLFQYGPQWRLITLDTFQLCKLMLEDDRVSRVIPMNGVTEGDKTALLDFIYRFFLNFGLFNLRSNSRIIPQLSQGKFGKIVELLQNASISELWGKLSQSLYSERSPIVPITQENDYTFSEFIRKLYELEPVIFNNLVNYGLVILNAKAYERPLNSLTIIPTDLNLLRFYKENGFNITEILDGSNTPHMLKQSNISKQDYEITNVIIPNLQSVLAKFPFKPLQGQFDVDENKKSLLDRYHTTLCFTLAIPLQMMKLLGHFGGNLVPYHNSIMRLALALFKYNALDEIQIIQLAKTFTDKYFIKQLFSRVLTMDTIDRALDTISMYSNTICRDFINPLDLSTTDYQTLISVSTQDFALEVLDKLVDLPNRQIPLDQPDKVLQHLLPTIGRISRVPPLQAHPYHEHDKLKRVNLEIYAKVSQLATENILVIMNFARLWGFTDNKVIPVREKTFGCNITSLHAGETHIFSYNVTKLPFVKETHDMDYKDVNLIKTSSVTLRVLGLLKDTADKCLSQTPKPNPALITSSNPNRNVVFTGHSLNGSIASFVKMLLRNESDYQDKSSKKFSLYTFGELPWIDGRTEIIPDSVKHQINENCYRFLMPNDTEVSPLDITSNVLYYTLDRSQPLQSPDVSVYRNCHSMPYYIETLSNPTLNTSSFVKLCNNSQYPFTTTTNTIIKSQSSENDSSVKRDDNDFTRVCFMKHQHTRTFSKLVEYTYRHAADTIKSTLNRYTCLATPTEPNLMGRTALHEACEHQSDENLKLLLPRFPNKSLCDLYKGETPLHVAAKKGTNYTVKTLLDGGADKNAVDFHGRTPLMVACINGHLEIIKELVEKRSANVWIKDLEGHTAFYHASHNGHWEQLGFLMFKITSGNYDFSPMGIYHACKRDSDKALEWVNRILGTNIDPKVLTPDGETAIFAAAEYGNLKAITILVECGISVEHVNNLGETALHRACRAHKSDIIEYLINQAVDKHKFINQRDRIHDRMALDLLIITKYTGSSIINLLMEFVDPTYSLALVNSYIMDNRDLIKTLTAKGYSIHIRSGDCESTALHLLMKEGQLHLDTIKWLVEIQVDYNATDLNGQTILHLAIKRTQKDKKDLITYLVDTLKMDISAQDIEHKTPIYLAVATNQLEVLEIMYKQKDQPTADLSIRDSIHQRTPLLVAVMNKYEEITKWLIKHGSLNDLMAVDKDNRNILHYLFMNSGTFGPIDYLMSLYPQVVGILMNQIDTVFQQNPIELMIENNKYLIDQEYFPKIRSIISKYGLLVKNIYKVASYNYMASCYPLQSTMWYQLAFNNAGHKFKLNIAQKHISNLIELSDDSKLDINVLFDCDYHKGLYYLILEQYPLAMEILQNYLTNTLEPTVATMTPVEKEIYYATKILLAYVHIKMEPESIFNDGIPLLKTVSALLKDSHVYKKTELVQDYYIVIGDLCKAINCCKTSVLICEKMLKYNRYNWQARFLLAKLCYGTNKNRSEAEKMINSLVFGHHLNVNDKARAYQYCYQWNDYRTFIQMVENVDKVSKEYKSYGNTEVVTVNVEEAIKSLKSVGCHDEKTLERIREPVDKLIVIPDGESLFNKLFVSECIDSKTHKIFYRINKLKDQIKSYSGKFKYDYEKWHLNQLKKYYKAYIKWVIEHNPTMDPTKFVAFNKTLWDIEKSVGGRLITEDFKKIIETYEIYVNYNTNYHLYSELLTKNYLNPESAFVSRSLLQAIQCTNDYQRVTNFLLYEHEPREPLVIYQCTYNPNGTMPVTDANSINLDSKRFSEYILCNLLVSPGSASPHAHRFSTLTDVTHPFPVPGDLNLFYYSSRIGVNQILANSLTVTPGSPLSPSVSNLHNAIFCHPQMKEPICPSVIEKFCQTEHIAEEIVARWLWQLHHQNQILEKHRDSSLSDKVQLHSGLKLQIKLPKHMVVDVLKTLQKVSRKISNHYKTSYQPLTHIDLMDILYPTMRQYINYASEIPPVYDPNEFTLPIESLTKIGDSTINEETIDFIDNLDFSKWFHTTAPLKTLQSLNYVTVLKLHNINAQQLKELLFEHVYKTYGGGDDVYKFTECTEIQLYNPVDMDKIRIIEQLPKQLIKVMTPTPGN
ncbi:putative homeobox transcription factor [Tieghemostelium lacteum]|uniref:Putative homeobox transcription factor n=1 Tax=Tieghemostelium lacteum TaxID=361077 RepID=A0A151ZEM2_TIELA|nr:putative homeobox transcription factor [Tieghemostelium lacteum]|eukprot:KYQ92377.1 putative homeobox transcription factor [Tieghemostelium lacteum]